MSGLSSLETPIGSGVSLRLAAEADNPESSTNPRHFERDEALRGVSCVCLGEQESNLSILALALAFPAGIMGNLGGLPLLVLMFVAMYFLLIAPNQRKQKTWQTMLSKLKTGDKITTTGGIRGQIVSVKDDVLVIKVAPDNIKFEVIRSAIASVTTDEVAKS